MKNISVFNFQFTNRQKSSLKTSKTDRDKTKWVLKFSFYHMNIKNSVGFSSFALKIKIWNLK
jgi:hypothetical protein